MCYLGISLSAFWQLHCLVVYLYHISSFIKNSVSGAGERALGSEVDRLLGNHPSPVPSGAPPALAPHDERQKPAEAERQREDGRECHWMSCLLRKIKIAPIWYKKHKGFKEIWGLTILIFGEILFVLLKGHRMRNWTHVFAKQTNNYNCSDKLIWKLWNSKICPEISIIISGHLLCAEVPVSWCLKSYKADVDWVF